MEGRESVIGVKFYVFEMRSTKSRKLKYYAGRGLVGDPPEEAEIYVVIGKANKGLLMHLKTQRELRGSSDIRFIKLEIGRGKKETYIKKIK